MKIFEKKNETKLLSSIAINKIGNVMYDYGNSTWIAGLGAIGQKYMGYYQLAENVISLILNPIGGAVADRFQRRKILLVTDFIGGLMCALLALIGNDNIMLYGLIAVNAILAMMHAFSGTSFKSYVATIVDEDRLVAFNSSLEVISQVVSISSPLLAFLFVDRFGLKPTLVLDSVTFFLSFLLLFSIREEEKHVSTGKGKTDIKTILVDIKDGMVFIVKEKEIFFLLIIASFVNFFIAAFNYLAPFSNQMFCDSSSYATLLSMGAAGSIAGAVLTIFNIHFFSMVQKQVPNHMLGRVFSSIFTVAILFMPLSTAIMTALPFSVSIYTFAIIGVGVILVSICGFFYSKLVLC